MSATIQRAPHDNKNPYVMIRKATIEDSSLSWEARGILAYLLAKPNDWKIQVSDLIRQSPGGRDKTYRILKELRDSGYVEYRENRNELGRVTETEYMVSEKPFTDKADSAKTDREKPYLTKEPVLLSNETTKVLAPDGATVLPASPTAQFTMFDEIPAPTGVSADKPERARQPKKEPKSYIHPVTHVSTADIMSEYTRCMEENEPGSAISYPREGKGALVLAQNGWTPQTVRDCYVRMKREDFWRRKHLSLHSVAATIGSVLGAPPTALPKAPQMVKIIDYVTGKIREVAVR